MSERFIILSIDWCSNTHFETVCINSVACIIKWLIERTWNILSYVNLIHNTISNMKSRDVTSSDRKKEETWVRVERKLSQLYIRLRYSNASQCAKQPFQLFSSNWWLLVLINQGLINTYEYQCWSMPFRHTLYHLKSYRIAKFLLTI